MMDNEGTSDIYFLQKSDAAVQPVPPITPGTIKEKLAALSDEIKALSWDNLDGAEVDVRRIKGLIEEIETDIIEVWHRRLFSGKPLPDVAIEVWTVRERKEIVRAVTQNELVLALLHSGVSIDDDTKK